MWLQHANVFEASKENKNGQEKNNAKIKEKQNKHKHINKNTNMETDLKRENGSKWNNQKENEEHQKTLQT